MYSGLPGTQALTMLVFVLSAFLCFLYAAENVILYYCYSHYAQNPATVKLLLSEAVKLFVASCLWLRDMDAVKLGRNGEKDAEYLEGCLAGDVRVAVKLDKQQQASSTRVLLWHSGRAWAWTLLAFGMPSLCYFATNNLSYSALTVLSGHQYTLLSDLNILATCLLSCFALRQQLSTAAVLSLGGLFLGVCTGQYSTMRATAGSVWTSTAGTDVLAVACVLMLVISAVSAVSSVYTEWLMNHSRFRHESLNVQNMQLYAVGLLLNAAYYWHSGGQLEDLLSDMMALHWLVVLLLALMGLVTGAVIKHYGNIVKVYASAIASLFAAWASQLLQQHPPPPMFYAGVCLVLAATVHLQQQGRSACPGSADGAMFPGGNSRTPPRHGRHQQHRFKASMVVPLAIAFILISSIPQIVPWSQAAVGSRGDAVDVAQNIMTGATPMLLPGHADITANLVSPSVTKLRMPALPPFEPTCSVRFSDRTRLGCRPMNCSLAETCTVEDTSCCAYYNYWMLLDFDNLLQSKGIQEEYAVVYGTALGAARNGTILGHTHDIDVALSPTGLQVLAQNATREQLWRMGYVFWQFSGIWRMCPHDLHPVVEFRTAMVHNMTVPQWEEETYMTAAVYMDGYLMWQKPAAAASCSDIAADANTAILMQPHSLVGVMTPVHAIESTDQQLHGMLQQHQEGSEGSEADATKMFCLQQSALPIVLKPGARNAVIAGRRFPAPENLKEHLANTYGPNWQAPDTTTHGETQQTPDVGPIQQALLSRLSVTAWGDVPWPVRKQRCAELQKNTARDQPAASELLQRMLEGPDMDLELDQQHIQGQKAAAAYKPQQQEEQGTEQRPAEQRPTEQREVLKHLASEVAGAQKSQQEVIEREVH